jgi:F0F1-type ATP synthase membrane subunit b/b'
MVLTSLLARVPFLAWALVASLLWGGYGHWQVGRLEKARVDAELNAEREVRKVEAEQRDAVQAVEATYASKLKEAQKTASNLRLTTAGLQQLLARSDSARTAETICGVNGERGRAIEQLLAESADLAREGAETVKRLGAKTASLQNYIERVCLGGTNANH